MTTGFMTTPADENNNIKVSEFHIVNHEGVNVPAIFLDVYKAVLRYDPDFIYMVAQAKCCVDPLGSHVYLSELLRLLVDMDNLVERDITMEIMKNWMDRSRGISLMGLMPSWLAKRLSKLNDIIVNQTAYREKQQRLVEADIRKQEVTKELEILKRKLQEIEEYSEVVENDLWESSKLEMFFHDRDVLYFLNN